MYIVFDIGGTKMRLAASKDGETIGEPVIVKTPQSFDEGVSTFRATVQQLTGGEPPKAIAGGVRGPLDGDKNKLLSEVHLTDWVEKPLAETLSELCEAPVYLENDTAMVGLGEAVAGAGQGFEIVAYLTVSTGVGGVRIVGGTIDEAAIGFEPGKEIIDPDNSLCPTCEGNTLEAYVSGASVEKRFGIKPYEITDPNVWHELSKYLAVGVYNIVVTWSPHVVVLGGSMITGTPAIDVEDVAKHMKEYLTVFPEAPPVKKAELGDVGGLHGALAYLQSRLSAQ